MSKNLDLKEGYILDYSTSKPVDIRKPEEVIRQQQEKILHEDYCYSKNQMDIEVPIKIGVSVKRADIVIYKQEKNTKRNQYEDILVIVETKKTNRKDGVEQLTSYMQATSCVFGIWTNGNEIEYLYKISSGEVKRDYIFNIPRCGESLEEINNITKEKLKSVKNLKPIFKRILNTLYSNTNISRREKLGSEMIKLIFCKIFDEKYDTEGVPKFRISSQDYTHDEDGNKVVNYDKVKKKIQKLFSDVKNELSQDEIFSSGEEVTLDSKSVCYVVGELEQFSLLNTEKDVVGEAFETFAESKLVGEKGEFFTPREVVKLAIQILDPMPNQTIIDPACGSGGFLIYALEHVWEKMSKDKKYSNPKTLIASKKDVAERCFYGIDKEIDLVKICKAYMTIIGDGKSKITQENTLHPIEDFTSKAKELFTETKDGQIKLRQFNFVITNPPFGSKIKVLKHDSKYFDLGHQWKKNGDDFIKTNKVKETEPQELFIERCLQLLESGGKLAIVLPETYFHAPTKKHVLNYIKKNNNIIAIIDLPHNTFRPYCNAKTCLLVLQKDVVQQQKIIMAVAEEIGHDHTGRDIFRYDEKNKKFTDVKWDDAENIRSELKNVTSKENKNTFIVLRDEIQNDIFVPRYYWKKREEEIKRISNQHGFSLVSMSELIKEGIIKSFKGHGSPPSEFKGTGSIPYVRVADIVNWEVYKNPTALIPEHLYDKVKGKNGLDLEEKDILFVRRGSYRIGSVAMISKFDKKILLTNEITIFRVIKENNKFGIDPFYLMFALSHNITQKQLYSKIFIDTTLPNIGERWGQLLIPIFKDKNNNQEISKTIKETFEKKWEAIGFLSTLKEQFGDITT